ncbi:MAG: glycosyltransferase family 2 protein [bacterium]
MTFSTDVSVIIPTFNRAESVVRAVESVLNQDYPGFELVVVDDGSTDQTGQNLSGYKLRYLVQENRGVSAARNLGIKNSKGRYIAFLDSDDCWLSDKLSRQVDIMEKRPDIAVCHTEEIWYRRGVRVNPRLKHKKQDGWIFKESLPLCLISPSAAMLRRETLNKVGLFDERLPACEDYDLWLRITKDYPVFLIRDPLVVKQGGHADQLSRCYWGMDRFRVYALEKILAQLDRGGDLWLAAHRMLKRKCEILSAGCRKHGRVALADYYADLPGRNTIGAVPSAGRPAGWPGQPGCNF